MIIAKASGDEIGTIVIIVAIIIFYFYSKISNIKKPVKKHTVSNLEGLNKNNHDNFKSIKPQLLKKKTETQIEKTQSESIHLKNLEKVKQHIPDEGIRVTIDAKMKPIEPEELSEPKKNLRRILILGEILQRKV